MIRDNAWPGSPVWKLSDLPVHSSAQIAPAARQRPGADTEGVTSMHDERSADRWRWTMTGTAPASGSLVRGAEESGTVDAASAGEAVEQVVRHGWWDSFDQDESVTITVEPARLASDEEDGRDA